MPSIQKQVEEQIELMCGGSIVSITDFNLYGKYGTIKKVLLRIEEAGKIIRIIDGIYIVPKYSKLTNELIPPSISDVANHIADKYGWSIVPTGDACMNALGLSTQMPAHYEYISDGPYRKYDILGFSVNFKHTANKEIKSLSHKSGMIVQALKTLGKENVDEDIMAKIRENLTEEDKKRLLTECRKVTAWVYDFIKIIVE